MYRYRVNQHIIVKNAYSVSIEKIVTTKLSTVKGSQNLNLMQNMLTQ